jgi:hypothetical protein
MQNRRATLLVVLLPTTVLLIVAAPSRTSGANAAAPTAFASSSTIVAGEQGQVSAKAQWFTGGLAQWPLDWSPTAVPAELVQARLFRVYPRAETFDVTLSYQLMDMFLLTSGGRWLFDHEQSRVVSKMARFGIDFESPWPFLGRSLQPISTAEFRIGEDYKWSTDLSIRAGLRWNGFEDTDRSLSLMLECFQGESRTKQGYRQKMDYIGLAVHYGF